MNHIKFAWTNAYDVYSAQALQEAVGDRKDIISTTEADGYHFRSEGDLQPIMDVISEYEMEFEVLGLNPGVTLTAVKIS